jgi:hypothetical protein
VPRGRAVSNCGGSWVRNASTSPTTIYSRSSHPCSRTDARVATAAGEADTHGVIRENAGCIGGAGGRGKPARFIAWAVVQPPSFPHTPAVSLRRQATTPKVVTISQSVAAEHFRDGASLRLGISGRAPWPKT